MAGKGGGAWKVAYADFVTAMMAFFLVMWITAQNKPIKESIAQYFEDPFGSSKGATGTTLIGPNQSGRGRGRGPTNINLKSAPPAPERGTAERRPPKMLVFDDGDSTRTGTMILFEEHSAELTAEAREQLSALLVHLLGKPNKIEIRGHASRRPLPAGSPFQDAWQLSYARSVATMDFLVAGGIEPERIRLSQAAGYEPYSLRREPFWMAHNSRVEIFALSEQAHDLQGTREERAGEFRDNTPAKSD